jgi:uncharacterized protein YbjQ (UPF0145 family)
MDLWDTFLYVLTHLNEVDIWDAIQMVVNKIGNLQGNDLIEFFVYFGIIGFGIYIGFVLGTFTETKHYQSIQQREKKTLHKPVLSSRSSYFIPTDRTVIKTELVSASVVISDDYFKTIVALLKKYFGGHLTSYESLLDRARREVTLRIKEAAPEADMYLNLRMESTSLSKDIEDDSRASRAVELIAYATAIYLSPPEKQPDNQVEKISEHQHH